MSYLGIGSGMDMNTILDALLKAKAKPLEALATQHNKAVLAQDSWTSIGADLQSLLGYLDELRAPMTYRPSKASSSDDKVATATIGSSLQPGTSYSIRVQQLASSQSMYSRKVEANATLGGSGTLTLSSANDPNLALSVNYASDMKLTDLAKAINDAAAAKVKETGGKLFVQASVVDNRLVLSGTESGSSGGFNVADSAGQNSAIGSWTLASGVAYTEASSVSGNIPGNWSNTISLTTANGAIISVQVAVGDNMESLVEKLNQQYKSVTGDNRAAVHLGQNANGGSSLRFDSAIITNASGVGTISPTKYSGQDAVLNVNGVAVRSSTNEVSAIEGMKLTLKETGSTTLTVESATDDVVSAVKDFVNKFNSVYSDLKTRMENTLPTTIGTSPENMQVLIDSRDPLYGDSSMRGLVRDMQEMFFYIGTTGTFRTLSSLGIDTDREGKITLDEARLRKAVDSDAEGVANFFRGVAKVNEDGTESSVERTGGFANSSDTLLKRYTNQASGIVELQKTYYMRMQESYNQQINRMKEYLSREEETLMRKFSAADTAMARANEQYSRMQGLLSGLSTPSNNSVMSMFGM